MLAEKAFLELYPERKLGEFDFSVKYTAKFNKYNANVRRRGNKIIFNLSRDWQNIDEEIKLGIIQLLMNKLFKTKNHTQNIGLYEIFLKKIHKAVPKTKSDPVLESSFIRVNERYCFGLIEQPNLQWGSESFNKLGSYEYGSDTITISTIFQNLPESLLDFVMYHEALHKKHKFHSKNGRSYHHTKEFKKDESLFENKESVEKQISHHASRQRRRMSFFF